MYSLYHTHIWRKTKIRSKQNPVFPPTPDTMTTMTESFQPLQHLEYFGICKPNWNNVLLDKCLSMIIAFN